MTILCLASYEKGYDFLREARAQGCRVLLLTSLTLKDTARWPTEAISEIFYMPDVEGKWNPVDTRDAVSHLARTEKIDRIVPLDDFDLEMAAFLREHLRIPGLGESATRFFRDKLAMRGQARASGLNVPDFAHVLHDASLDEFIHRVPGPWVVKPRLMAGAIGIKKVHSPEEFWEVTNNLGNERSFYLVEKFVPGDVFHVDTVVFNGHVQFAIASGYGKPPLEVSHGGGIFTTRILEHGSDLERRLLIENERVMRALGLTRGVSHTEFIVGREDGTIYFLETSARVGGAHIADLIEAATGLNMWREWAKVEATENYEAKPTRNDYAGLLVSLARHETPDTSAYNDPEIVWRMDKTHHVGLIVRSPEYGRVQQLLESYTHRVQGDFHASLPAKDRPTF